jgi:putative flippase GtrA
MIEKIIRRFYYPFIGRIFPYDTYRYAVCGGSNTAFDILLYATLYNFIFDKKDVSLGFVVISPHIAAFLTVFPTTLFTGYWLMNNVAFHGSPLRGRTKMMRYLLVVCFNLAANYGGLKFFVEYAHFYPTPSKILVTLFCTAVSYLSQKYFTFRKIVRSGEDCPD